MLQIQNFQVKNIGGSTATGCIASMDPSSRYFSSSSNQFDVPPGGKPVSVPINVNFIANPNQQYGYIKILCQISVKLLGGTISAIFGATAATGGAGGTPPFLSFTPDGINSNGITTVPATISNSGSTLATSLATLKITCSQASSTSTNFYQKL